MNGIINFLRHNFLCILISKIIHWDDLKNFLFRIKTKRNNYIIALSSKGPYFYLPYFEIDHIQKQIAQNKNFYDYELLDYICNSWKNGFLKVHLQDSSILDIGSNIGNHSIYFFYKCRIKESYNFEPIKDTFKILEKNVEINHLNSHLYNVGIGAAKGKAKIVQYDKANIGATKITKQESGDLQLISIDELSISSRISFVKIDVEGFEKDVIQGMHKLISRDKPIILIEIWNQNHTDIDSYLKSLGYSVDKLNSDDILGNYIYYINQ
jgi:FkbM family methyltransferase